MKVELLRDGAAECPLVRFYSLDGAEFSRLKRIADRLGKGAEQPVDISAAGGFDLINIRQLLLSNVQKGGMTEQAPGCLSWGLAPEDWEAVCELLEPLCEPSTSGSFQWLDEAGRGISTGFAVLASVSDDGAW